MKRLILFLLLAFSLPAQTFHIMGVSGAQTVFRGGRSWVAIEGGWYNTWRTVTVTPASDIVNLTSHGYTTASDVCFRSTGTMPLPLNDKVCFPVGEVVDLNSFKLTAPGTSEVMDLTTAGTGTLEVSNAIAHTASPITWTSVVPPSGVTMEAWRPAWHSLVGTTSGITYTAAHESIPIIMMIGFTASSTATLGADTVTVTLNHADISGGTVDVEIPITVVAMPTFNVTRPASYPAIVGLENWERSRRSLAARNCDNSTGTLLNPNTLANLGTMSFSDETKVWYYDGGLVFDGLAEDEDEAWATCGATVLEAYRNNALTASSITAFRAFYDGLIGRFVSTRDGRYREAISQMLTKAAFAPKGAYPDPVQARESAYVLAGHMANATMLGTPLSDIGQRQAEVMMSIIDHVFVRGDAVTHQVLYDALMMKELIRYWEITGDPRAAHYVKIMLDWLWDNAYLGNGIFPYNPVAFGSGCYYEEKCNDLSAAYSTTELTGLIMPGWGWYYSVTGDTTYSTRGDELLSNMALTLMPDSIDTAGDRLNWVGHGFTEGQAFTWGGELVGGILYVRNPLTDSFQISYQHVGGTMFNFTTTDVRQIYIYTGIDITYSGKVFSQNYRWSPWYVNWRQLLR